MKNGKFHLAKQGKRKNAKKKMKKTRKKYKNCELF